MIPSSQALALLGAAGLVVLAGLVVPYLSAVGLALDAVILVLILIDARRAARATLHVQRTLPTTLHQDEAAEAQLRIDNPGALPLDLRIRAVLPGALADAPIEERVTVPPESRVELPLPLTPRRRGEARIPPVAIRVSGPWGLGLTERSVLETDTVRVLPTARLDGEQGLFIERALNGTAGAHARQRRGHSTELYALREYQSGDTMRSIHWRASARRGRPVTRETIWEQHQHVVLLLDAGRPMAARADHRSKFDHALTAALALMRIAVKQNDSASLVLYSRELRRVVRVDRRTRSFRPAFEALHAEQADLQEPDLGPAVSWCAKSLPRRSLVLVVTSVLDAQGAGRLSAGLQGLARRHRPVLVNLEDPGLVAHARSLPDDLPGTASKISGLAMVGRLKTLAVRLRAAGVEVVDVPADRLAIGMIEAYFRHKAQAGSGGRIAG